MTVKVINPIDFKAIAKRNLASLENGLKRHLQQVTSEIQIRTNKGSEIQGAPMRPYSQEYAEARRKRRYSSSVNLTVTGNMLGAMTSTARREGDTIRGEIFFNNTSSRSPFGGKSVSAPDKARFNLDRNWFGLSDQQNRELKLKIQEFIRND